MGSMQIVGDQAKSNGGVTGGEVGATPPPAQGDSLERTGQHLDLGQAAPVSVSQQQVVAQVASEAVVHLRTLFDAWKATQSAETLRSTSSSTLDAAISKAFAGVLDAKEGGTPEACDAAVAGLEGLITCLGRQENLSPSIADLTKFLEATKNQLSSGSAPDVNQLTSELAEVKTKTTSLFTEAPPYQLPKEYVESSVEFFRFLRDALLDDAMWSDRSHQQSAALERIAAALTSVTEGASQSGSLDTELLKSVLVDSVELRSQGVRNRALDETIAMSAEVLISNRQKDLVLCERRASYSERDAVETYRTALGDDPELAPAVQALRELCVLKPIASPEGLSILLGARSRFLIREQGTQANVRDAIKQIESDEKVKGEFSVSERQNIPHSMLPFPLPHVLSFVVSALTFGGSGLFIKLFFNPECPWGMLVILSFLGGAFGFQSCTVLTREDPLSDSSTPTNTSKPTDSPALDTFFRYCKAHRIRVSSKDVGKGEAKLRWSL